jgi:hypothetical protein
MQSPTSCALAFLALTNDQEIVLRLANLASHLSTLSPICCRLRPSLQSLAYTNIPHLQVLRSVMFLYLVCYAYYVNLLP